ncbi:hypothetical protein G4P69_02390 [Aetokthonos hydrillicola CCALA 1050]|jgi:hypothetical protein|nr:hypothetical protein [Aetokthonos hydrillicola CCALA 1050]
MLSILSSTLQTFVFLFIVAFILGFLTYDFVQKSSPQTNAGSTTDTSKAISKTTS